LTSGYVDLGEIGEPNIYKKYDNFRRLTYYRHSKFFEMAPMVKEIVSPIEIYLVKSDIITTTRIKFRYVDNYWIFFNEVILINSEGDRVFFKIDPVNISRIAQGRGLVETADIVLSLEKELELRKVLNDKENVKMRFSGNHDDDYKLSSGVVSYLIEMFEFRDNILPKLQ